MAIEDDINALVSALNESEYTKNESMLILKEYINTVCRGYIPPVVHNFVSETTTDFTKRVDRYDWKFAHGFYGNWAKHEIEKKKGDDVDQFDVSEIGC